MVRFNDIKVWDAKKKAMLACFIAFLCISNADIVYELSEYFPNILFWDKDIETTTYKEKKPQNYK